MLNKDSRNHNGSQPSPFAAMAQKMNNGGSGSSPKAPKKRKKHKRSIFVYFLRFCCYMLCLGVIAGCVVAVMLSRYVVTATADDDELLDLDNIELAQTSILYARNHDTGEWEEYDTLSSENQRIWVDLEQVPENLQWAFICTEDKDYYNEIGVNFKRTIGAALNEVLGNRLYGSRQGASTIEQQLIKNLTGDDKQDAMRKVREIFRAIGLDKKYSKETILEAYLNTISLTGTIAGVQAGANEYFGKDVSELTLAECAVIASITKNPTRYNPYTNPEEILTRRNDILTFMYQQEKITESEYDAACAEPLVLQESNTTSEVTTSSSNSYFTDAVFTSLVSDIMDKEDCTESEARNIIYTGGLRIYCTVDPYMQDEMEKIMLNENDQYFLPYWVEEEVTTLSDDDLPVYEEDGVTLKTGVDEDGNDCYYRRVRTQAAMVTMDYDGQVKAMVGGLGEKTSDLTLNRCLVPRQTGSSMKPIAAYSLALEYGAITYSSSIMDTPFYSKADKKVLNTDYCRSHGYSTTDIYSPAALADPNAWRDWPSNYSGTYKQAPVLVYDALAQSLNTVAVWVGSYVGAENMFNFAHDTLQMENLQAPDDVDYGPIVLGSQTHGVTPVELAGAYQIFNDGSFTKPHLYTEVDTYDGEVYLDTAAELTTVQALSEETATIMNRLLRNVVTIGTARGMAPDGEMDAVAKTGTTSDFKDYTFAGLTPYYVTSLWWGFDTPINMYDLGAKSGKPMQLVWKQYMETVQADLEYKEFFMSENVVQKNFDSNGNVGSGSNVGYYTVDNLPDNSATLSAEDLAAQYQASTGSVQDAVDAITGAAGDDDDDDDDD